jgi:hypothetical protein
MKKYVLSVILLVGTLTSNAQNSNTSELSEEESIIVTESYEFNNLANYQLRFMEIVNGALSQGITLTNLKMAAKESIETGNDEIFCRMIFADPELGKKFLEDFSNAKKQFIEANPRLAENRDAFICTTCKKSNSEQAEVFFDVFEKYHVSKPLLENTDQGINQYRNGYTCGSAWNRVKLILCAASCAIPSGMLATAFCGWRCWCQFCSENSELGSIICLD